MRDTRRHVLITNRAHVLRYLTRFSIFLSARNSTYHEQLRKTGGMFDTSNSGLGYWKRRVFKSRKEFEEKYTLKRSRFERIGPRNISDAAGGRRKRRRVKLTKNAGRVIKQKQRRRGTRDDDDILENKTRTFVGTLARTTIFTFGGPLLVGV